MRIRNCEGIAFLAVFAITFSTAKANADELIVNGGFETGDFTGWTVTTDGATFVQPSGGAGSYSAIQVTIMLR